jgi:hypothetical protein
VAVVVFAQEHLGLVEHQVLEIMEMVAMEILEVIPDLMVWQILEMVVEAVAVQALAHQKLAVLAVQVS